jgi:hypothetical protein
MIKNHLYVALCQLSLFLYWICSMQYAYAYSPNTEANYHYLGKLSFIPEQGFIKVNWNITVNNDEEHSLTFVLRSTLDNVTITGEHVSSFSIKESELGTDFQRIDIQLIPEQNGQNRNIYLSYQGALLSEPMSNQINQISSNAIELNVDSFWLPMDTRFNQLLTTEIEISTERDWQMVGSGQISKIKQGYKFINNTPSLDISFALSKYYSVSKMSGYTLYDLRKDKQGTTKLTSSINFCLTQLNKKYGENNPLNNIQFTINDRPSSGYARKIILL